MNYIQIFKDKIDKADIWEKDIRLTRGEYLKVSGSRDTNLYYVVEGSLRIYFEDQFVEQTLRLGYQGNFIAALDSFITNQPSDLYIQALKKTKLKSISKDAFEKLVRSSPEIIEIWHIILSGLIHEQIEREKDILIQSPMERYQRVLKRSPQVFQNVPHKYIASYLRMTPETLSRLKKS